MSIWTRNPYQSTVDTAESLADAPSGGRVKMWLAGVGGALIPFGYGIHCLRTGHAWLPSSQGSGLETTGPAAVSLAIAYISIGCFLHFHFFWGLHPKLYWVSPLMKVLTLLVFLASLGYAVYKIILL